MYSSMHWNNIFAAAFLVLGIAVFFYARSIRQGGKPWWAFTVLAIGLASAGMLIPEGIFRTLCVDAAAFSAVGLLWSDNAPKARAAARTYLVVVGAAVLCLLGAEFLSISGQPAAPLNKLVIALLLVGFALKLALIPLYFWLPQVAESAAPMSVAVILSVVDIAAFTELAHLQTTHPWVFADHRELWIAMALLSMFGGAILAIGQTSLRRMLAFSTIDDLGYLLLGVCVGTEVGITGAMLGALAHALFKVILFGATGIAENGLGHTLTLKDHGLAGRFPWAGFAFIVASLGMIGVPPMIGFSGRWRLYLSGITTGGLWLGVAMALATILTLFYYVRAIHRIWMGSPDDSAVAAEPRLAGAVLIALVCLALVLGMIPAWLLSL